MYCVPRSISGNPLPKDTPPRVRQLLKRCLDRDVRNRLRDIGEARVALEGAGVEEDRPTDAPPQSRPRRSPWIVAAALLAAGLLVAAAGWYRATRPVAEMPPWTLTRLTSDPGLSGSAALSPDGKLVAYSLPIAASMARRTSTSSRLPGASRFVWTSGMARATRRARFFAPDGTRLVFRSSFARNGGGIYEDSGVWRRCPPRGARWVQSQIFAGRLAGGLLGGRAGRVRDGARKRHGVEWFRSRAANRRRWDRTSRPPTIRSGRRMESVCCWSDIHRRRRGDASGLDWWHCGPGWGRSDKDRRVAGCAAPPRECLEGPLSQRLLKLSSRPGWLVDRQRHVIFSQSNGDTSNLWEIGISPRTGKVTGVPTSLTAGAGNEVAPACTSVGALAFTNVETRTDIWSLPFDMDQGKASGTLERFTQGAGVSGLSLVSARWAQRRFFFQSIRGWQHLEAGSGHWERIPESVARSGFRQRFAVSNASGDRIAFSEYEGDKRMVYLSAPGGTPEKLLRGLSCERQNWSPRQRRLCLIFGGNPYQVNVLDIATHRQTLLLKHPEWSVLYGHFSPDNRWVSFTVRTASNRGRIAIAPVDGPKPVPESAWITIAEEGQEDWANWSPDGKTLYFTSARDGHYCLWGQRIDAASHQPMGDAFAVQHLHGRLSYQQGGWSARAAAESAWVIGTDGWKHSGFMTRSPRAIGVRTGFTSSMSSSGISAAIRLFQRPSAEEDHQTRGRQYSGEPVHQEQASYAEEPVTLPVGPGHIDNGRVG